LVSEILLFMIKSFHMSIGIFNASMLVTNQYGRSLVSSNLYRVSANEKLYHFQSYAGLFNLFSNTKNKIVKILF
jgi:hypothetical protein